MVSGAVRVRTVSVYLWHVVAPPPQARASSSRIGLRKVEDGIQSQLLVHAGDSPGTTLWNSSKAILTAMRAMAVPRQAWTPPPKPRWPRGLRARS